LNAALLAILQAPSGGGYGGLVIAMQFAAIFAIFYFLLIRPQKKEQERHKDMLGKLSKGDEVITNGGIIGTIVHVKDDRLTIKTGEDTRVVVQRARIAQLIKDVEAGSS
jgi:preprotein translocase subunit YajC